MSNLNMLKYNDPHQMLFLQSQSAQAPVAQNSHNDQHTSPPDILNIMQRQNEITALLVQQNTASALPEKHTCICW